MIQDRTRDRGTRPTSRRRWRRFVVVVLSLVALAVLLFWYGRGLPRRWLEGRLASMLDAQVRLERLEVDNLHHFVLHGIHISRVRWEPRLERLSIERLDVEAPIREALRSRYEKLAADGVDVRLAPSVEPSSPPP